MPGTMLDALCESSYSLFLKLGVVILIFLNLETEVPRS